ncbi:hypothetical protein EW026_g1120 [Hermanssonia centrifuga]|uniref:Uncharacterized protein n=1 Tax=Hermanssonia centrifuga TaxID=98765 RepID=A0A4S4KT37_9APHY|nr:hypothetical protein EW026_g1120 [Hermanssonia centrifuga]
MNNDIIPEANSAAGGDEGQTRRNQPQVPTDSQGIQDITPFGRRLNVRRVMSMWGGDEDYATTDDLQVEQQTYDSTQYAFTIVRPNPNASPIYSNHSRYSFWTDRRIHVRSEYFMKAAKVVMQAQKNIAWDAYPVKVSIMSVSYIAKVEKLH